MKLKADQLTCVRGGRVVFRDISFALSSGESLLLTGPNGSGKTSLLRMVAGFIDPADGQLDLDGGDKELSIGQHAHLVGHLDAVKAVMTVEENVTFWSAFLGGGDVENALETFKLDHLREIPAGLLSAGQKRRLGLCRLALVPRALWLLDEPSVSLDEASRKILAGLVDDHVADGGMVMASTHSDLGSTFSQRLDFAERRAAS